MATNVPECVKSTFCNFKSMKSVQLLFRQAKKTKNCAKKKRRWVTQSRIRRLCVVLTPTFLKPTRKSRPARQMPVMRCEAHLAYCRAKRPLQRLRSDFPHWQPNSTMPRRSSETSPRQAKKILNAWRKSALGVRPSATSVASTALCSQTYWNTAVQPPSA